MGSKGLAALRSPHVAVFFLATALWAIHFLTAGDPVLGVGIGQQVLETAAVAITALLGVMVTGAAILGMAPTFTGAQTTGFQRVAVYTLLTFAAAFVTLRYLGFNFATVFTTSAIASATVGFAMQPTLASLIAGLSLHSDHAVRVGDFIVLDTGETVEVVSMNWRAAMCRRIDGRRLVIPNAKIINNTAEVVHAGEPHRSEMTFLGPIDYPPQPICDLVREAVSDLPAVDQELVVAVAPVGFEPDKNATRFRVQYWTRDYHNRTTLDGEIARRVWYLFQRNRIAFPHPTACAVAVSQQQSLDHVLLDPVAFTPRIDAWLAAHKPAARGRAPAIAKAARILLYASDERVTLPEWAEGWSFVLYRGEARAVPEFDLSPEIDGTPETLAVQELGPAAMITHLGDELARLIGPYAKIAVARAGTASRNFEQLCRVVALEIEDPSKRATFLKRVLPQAAETFLAGADLRARRNVSGTLMIEPSMRARTEVAILAIPPDAFAETSARAAAE